MQLLYVLEKLRVPGLNEFMLLITHLGEETAFLAAALILFWCVDKRRGYYVMAVGFIGTIFNQFLKLLFRIPRPWVLDENFSILEGARAGATGYSFPSGHSQTAVGTFGAIACTTGRKWIRWICIAVAVLVPISRMYAGVHTPTDVITGTLMSLAFVLLLKPMACRDNPRGMKDVLGGMLFLSIALLAFVKWFPFPEDTDLENLQSGWKNAYALLGSIAGICVVYPVERKYVRFDTKAVWWVQILKCALGLALVLLVKSGLRAPLEMILPVYPARLVRYFLVVLTAGLFWPLTFRFWSGLGEKHELR